MKDEIKEILDKLKSLDYDEYNLEVSVDYIERKEEKLLLDCITNLQEELEEQKRIEQASLDTINNLQNENEILKENAIHNDKVVDKAKWNEMIYKQINEKAIEYIKEHIKYECDDTFNGMSFYSYHLYDFKKEDLLNILNGGDDNDKF